MGERFFHYLLLQYKRAWKLVPAVLLITALLLGSIGLLGSLVLKMNHTAADQSPFPIGIVGDPEDPYISLGMFALQNLDSSRYSVSFSSVSAEDAPALLRSGALRAYIVIPEDFAQSAGNGTNLSPILYVSTDGAVSIGSLLIDEIVTSVSRLLTETQNAVFGMMEYGADHAYPGSIGALGDSFAASYLNAILLRDELYSIRIVGFCGSASFFGYYICSFTVLFLLLWGISCSPLFTGRENSMLRLLNLRGCGCAGQVAAEYAAYLAMMAASLVFTMLLILAGIALTGFSVPELEGITPLGALSLLVQILPAAAGIAALQFLLYELTDGVIASILAQFLAAMALGYLSGCLYPIDFFPEHIRSLGNLLLPGTARQYLTGCLQAEPDLMLLGAILLRAAALLAAAWLLRRRKINAG